MKTILLTAMLLLLPVLAMATGLGTSHGHDLDALWTQAQQTLDLDGEDAVLLLESRAVTYTTDGVLATTVHRVVWVNTAVGIRNYADLRIPWNTFDSTLEVEILRTWREGRWWPDVEQISDTAVVHTLPHALDHADDYTCLRETMLLHDGVELGCIMETRYTITSSDRPGSGGVFVFPQRDPALRVELTITGETVRHEELNGVPVPIPSNNTRTWRQENLAPLKLPLTADAAVYEPSVVWSTWSDWNDLGRAWLMPLAAAATLEPEQTTELKDRLAGQTEIVSRLQVVGEYLNDMTRLVRYPDHFWAFSPRPASRTLATAYGHALDRAALALALLEEAGFTPDILFLGSGQRLVGADLPRLADAGNLAFEIPHSDGLIFHPDTGLLSDMATDMIGPVWRLGEAPQTLPLPVNGQPHPSKFNITVNLEPSDADGWEGTLFTRATGYLTPYGALVTADDFRTGPAADLLTSLLPSAEITQARPEYLSPGRVAVKVSFTMPALAADTHGRTVLELGQPTGGLLARLTHRMHLYDQKRETPVLGLGNMQQTVTLRLKTDGSENFHTPTPVALDTPTGRFNLTVTQEGDWLVLKRELYIIADTVPATDWPDLRQLLLTESNPVHGAVEIE